MATYCRHPYIQLRARSSVSLRSGGSILQRKAGPFLASGEARDVPALFCSEFTQLDKLVFRVLAFVLGANTSVESDFHLSPRRLSLIRM